LDAEDVEEEEAESEEKPKMEVSCKKPGSNEEDEEPAEVTSRRKCKVCAQPAGISDYR